MVDKQVAVEQGQAPEQVAEGAVPIGTGVEQAGASAGKPGSGVEPGKKGPARPPAIEALKPGMKFKGKVRNVVDFGAFVDIGVGRDGLVHVSLLKKAGIDKSVQVGASLDVVVRRIEPNDNRISLTLPGLDQERESKTPLGALRVGSVVTGHVVRLADFGAFVDIGGQVDGLLHVSQLPWGYVNNPSEVLRVGDEVQVRIQEVDPRKRRISLSMRDLGGTAAQQEEAPVEEEADSQQPTAFQLAFEKAQSRRRQRRVRA